MNGLLVPDRSSLTGRSQPYDWTYNDGTTVDDIAKGMHQGMVAMIGDLCANEWGTAVPPPGRIPSDKRPNLMVALPVPITLRIGDCLLAPIFSTRERAVAFIDRVPGLSAKVDAGEWELLEIRSNRDVQPPAEVISFSFARLEEDHSARLLQICLDPVPQNDEWTNINATAAATAPLADVLRDKIRIVSVPVDAPMAAYVWRVPFVVK
jgi:hypothetical protein